MDDLDDRLIKILVKGFNSEAVAQVIVDYFISEGGRLRFDEVVAIIYTKLESKFKSIMDRAVINAYTKLHCRKLINKDGEHVGGSDEGRKFGDK